MKVKIRLKADIDQPGQGFLDPAGQKIRAKHPKPGEKFVKGQIFEVEKTDFVIERIKTGELVLVEDEKSSAIPQLNEKERKARFKEAGKMLEDLRAQLKKEKPTPELQAACDEVLATIEKSIREESVELLLEAEQKFQAIAEAFGKK